MKKLSILTITAFLALTGVGCGNDSLLSAIGADSMNGDGNNSEGEHEEEPGCSNEADQAAAIHALGENICVNCWPADGTAEVLMAKLTPEAYDGGPLEVGLVIGSPNGLVDTMGAFRVDTVFRINDVNLEIPDTAWKLSEDGTKGRVVLLLEPDGLPPGEYHVKLGILDAGVAAFNETEVPAEGEEPAPAHEAFDDATWFVHCPDVEEPPAEEPPAEEPPAEEPPAEEPPAEEPAGEEI